MHTLICKCLPKTPQHYSVPLYGVICIYSVPQHSERIVLDGTEQRTSRIIKGNGKRLLASRARHPKRIGKEVTKVEKECSYAPKWWAFIRCPLCPSSLRIPMSGVGTMIHYSEYYILAEYQLFTIMYIFRMLIEYYPRALKNSNQLSYVEEQSWQKEQSGSKNNNNNMDNIPCVVHHPSHSLICQPVSCPFDCGVAFPLRLASNTSHTKGALLGSSAFPADVQSINRLIKVSDGY